LGVNGMDKDALAYGTLENGRAESVDDLVPVVYGELRRMAHRLLARRGDATLATTGLVHEAYLRIADQSRVDALDQAHFLSLAALTMRHVLIDRARARCAAKRGGEPRRVTLEEDRVCDDEQPEALLEINDAVDRLAAIDPRLAQVVLLRFFGGLSHEEIAAARGVDVRTVERDWAKARTLLQQLLAR
jgi:RNA polymerase sigma factor (TIGR02999 family)